MEHTLRCNALKCRKELSDFAVVTTCSHVFCADCSNRCQLSGQREGQSAICPACDMRLTNPDDVVVTNLNPTEDYKTSVLSGLSPNVIMECAGRGLSFWAYQTTQEIVYQEYLAKNLADKQANMSMQLDKIVHDANGEISNLRNKMSNMSVEQDNLRRKNEEIAHAFREKSRKLLQTQELYDKLKRRGMLGQVQNAASDAVDYTFQASVLAGRHADRDRSQNQDHNQNQPQNPVQPIRFPLAQNSGMQYSSYAPINSGLEMAPPVRPENGDGTWTGFSQESAHDNPPIQTPSTHRQRLAPGIGTAALPKAPQRRSNSVSGTPISRRHSNGRSPLESLNINPTVGTGFAGYGMSAGLKVSHPAGSNMNGFLRPVDRSRVAQRPTSAFAANGTFGTPATAILSKNYY